MYLVVPNPKPLITNNTITKFGRFIFFVRSKYKSDKIAMVFADKDIVPTISATIIYIIYIILFSK
jgi:hypothetical protein